MNKKENRKKDFKAFLNKKRKNDLIELLVKKEKLADELSRRNLRLASLLEKEVKEKKECCNLLYIMEKEISEKDNKLKKVRADLTTYSEGVVGSVILNVVLFVWLLMN